MHRWFCLSEAHVGRILPSTTFLAKETENVYFLEGTVAKVLVVTLAVCDFRCLYVAIASHWAPQEPSNGMTWPLFLAA